MLKAFSRGPELEQSGFYMGHVLSFLARNQETNGRVAVVDGKGRVGNEPPPHVHDWEHEMYYVLEGEIEFFCEGQEESMTARAGEMAFIPQGAAHALYFKTPTIRTLILVVATGEKDVGVVEYFAEVAEPAKSLEIPEEGVSYLRSGEEMEQLAALSARMGSRFLAPDEVGRRLPKYPGFGANLRDVGTDGGQ